MASIDSSSPQAPIFLAGPTATGKSAVAMILADSLRGEIISVDSMQVYRGLDIGTAKPSCLDRERVRHHLIDVADLSTSFDAAHFCTQAKVAVTDIQQRGFRPILVGGTGLYFKAYLEGLGDSPPADLALREQLARSTLPELLEELRRLDPETFARIDGRNRRRVERAMEVIRLTGTPFSARRARWQPPGALKTETFFGLARQSSDLLSRINTRVDTMFSHGFVREVELLRQCGLEMNRTALQAIGYRQIMEHLRGDRSLEATVELVKIRTRQFARRQMKWFRRQSTLNWLDLDREESSGSVASRITDALRLIELPLGEPPPK